MNTIIPFGVSALSLLIVVVIQPGLKEEAEFRIGVEFDYGASFGKASTLLCRVTFYIFFFFPMTLAGWRAARVWSVPYFFGWSPWPYCGRGSSSSVFSSLILPPPIYLSCRPFSFFLSHAPRACGTPFSALVIVALLLQVAAAGYAFRAKQ